MGKQLGPSDLSASDLLLLWERAATQHPIDRSLTILAATDDLSSPRELARLPCGERDARLLSAYAHSFGNQLEGQGACPSCGEMAEFVLDVRSLLAAHRPLASAETFILASAAYQVSYRLPNSFDLAEITALTQVVEARRLLLERCIQQVRCGDAILAWHDLPVTTIDALITQMETQDPLGLIALDLSCPFCTNDWQLVFDISTFLWLKIDSNARRLLREVHTLALAYGWREADILALSPARRRSYLAMVI